MNKIIKYTVSGFLVAASCVGLGFLNRSVREERVSMACTGLDVTFRDSLEFVSEQDVKGYIDSLYGVYLGKQIDSVDLGRVEEILESRSAILSSEAWMTDDGLLHVSITQRAPAVRFQNGGEGFYVDDRGFIFPLHPDYTADVPLVEGDIPVKVSRGFKGEARTEEEALWLKEMIDLTRYMNSSAKWAGKFQGIRVAANGDIMLQPLQGNMEFIFGEPRSIAEKFGRIEKYYTYIHPLKGDTYGTINIKYKGQIICRTKDM